VSDCEQSLCWRGGYVGGLGHCVGAEVVLAGSIVVLVGIVVVLAGGQVVFLAVRGRGKFFNLVMIVLCHDYDCVV